MTTVYHPNVNTVVPWQANYTYPSQATQTHKQIVKIQPMGQQEFKHSQNTRITFQLPSDGYLNARNSAFNFTLRIPHLDGTGSDAAKAVWVTSATLTVVGRKQGATASGSNPVAVTVQDPIYVLQGFDVANRPHHWASTGIPTAAQLGKSRLSVIGGPTSGSSFTIPSASDLVVGTGSNYIDGGDGSGLGAGSPPSTHTYALPANSLCWKYGVDGGGSLPPGVYKVLLSSHGFSLKSAGIHGLFSRVVYRYGGLVLEDIQNYSTLAKILLTGGAGKTFGQSTGPITDGVAQAAANTLTQAERLASGYGGMKASASGILNAEATASGGWVNCPTGIQRTYTFNLFAGLATVQKLVPLKWMAASFRVELELGKLSDIFHMAVGADCKIANYTEFKTFEIIQPTYGAELMEFDSVYDTAFYMGMQQMGVPLKFTSWHWQRKQITGTGTQHFAIAENARSIKAAFTAITRDTESLAQDPFEFYHDAGIVVKEDGSINRTKTAKVQSYQWRIGGSYQPAQPVDCRYGAAEAYHEYSKAINTTGDYTFGSMITQRGWSSDYPGSTQGSDFVMAQEFENTDVFPNTIAGINAENQSDLMLKVTLGSEIGTAALPGAAEGASQTNLDTYISFDNLLIIRDGHLVDLIM